MRNNLLVLAVITAISLGLLATLLFTLNTNEQITQQNNQTALFGADPIGSPDEGDPAGIIGSNGGIIDPKILIGNTCKGFTDCM